MAPKDYASSNFLQIALVLDRRIQSGAYSPGQWLPAERDLADELGVHRRTVRAAILHLAREGRLECRPRCRPLVLASLAAQPGPEAPDSPVASGHTGARLVALIMWHGGLEPRTTAQQRIFWGCAQVLSRADYHVVFLNLGEDIETEEENAVREAARLQYALDHQFAGIIFYPYAYRRNRNLIQDIARRMPLVLIDRQIPGVETDYVGIDNFSAMQDAANYLLAQGHTRVALVTRSEPINTVQDRIAGYRAAMRRANPPSPDRVITVDSELEWSMFDLIFRLPREERPTALLCVNDYIALRVAERLSALGIQAPQETALVGFDDLVLSLPNGAGLTSVAQPFEEIGMAAARLLLERITTPDVHARHIELHTNLSIRNSSSAPPSSSKSGTALVSI